MKILESRPISERNRCPVFVVGCHRSGTNLIYDTLISAGGFAVYHGLLPVYKLLIPRFGSLENLENRKKMMETWLNSVSFAKTGLDPEETREKVLRDCRTGGDFFRLIMNEIATKQHAQRWAAYDADNVIHLRRIKADIPEALFVHIVRDGRDVALSLKKMQGFRPFPWTKKQVGLLPTAVYWEWMVRKGQEFGKTIPADYTEIHYEELVSDPQGTLAKLGRFLAHDLDYDRIKRAGVGSLSESNSSFREEEAGGKANPIGRWRYRLSPQEIDAVEALIGRRLQDLGYSLSAAQARKPSSRERCLRTFYTTFLDSKLWLRMNTFVGRLSNLESLESVEESPGVN